MEKGILGVSGWSQCQGKYLIINLRAFFIVTQCRRIVIITFDVDSEYLWKPHANVYFKCLRLNGMPVCRLVAQSCLTP